MGTIILVNGKRRIAGDTGGAIIGRKIDVWFSSCREAINYGLRKVIVEVTHERSR